MNKKLILIIVATLGLASCDPAKILVIKSRPNSNASIVLYGNRKINPLLNDSASIEKKIIIQVPTADGKNEIKFNYGIGIWSNGPISNLSAAIDSIIITGKLKKTILKNQDSIKQYFINHRSGYGGSKLTIVAK
jgi:hypothetical protein